MNAETSPHWAITGSASCLPIGTRVAEFEITGVVGEGGFGNVYLAFDHSLQRTVAIKEYMPVALASRGADNAVLVQSKRHRETFATGMNSFINEARLLAQFDHPALIKVYRFWEQNNTAYMTMRYYEGQTFKNLVAKHPEMVSEAWLRPILKPILEALDVLYKIQILHRDISPDNIMIQTTGEAVLLDFGAARQILGDMSQALTVILKPGYAPVEQYAEDSDMKQGPWTDLYALCAVVYWAITKNPPPTSVTRLLKDPIELLQNGSHPGFSKEFLMAIDKGMSVRPQDRPQSIAEFLKLLDAEKTSAAATPLPAKPVNVQKKVDASAKAQETRDSQKVKPSGKPPSGVKAAAPSKKVSTKGSWILVVAGIVVATAGIYRIAHHDSGQAVDASQTSVAASNSVETSSASSPVAVSENSAGKSDTARPDATSTLASEKPEASAQNTSAGSPQKATETAVKSKDTHAVGTNAVTASASKEAPSASAGKPLATVPAASAGTAADASQTEDQKITGVFKLAVQPWATVYVDGTMKGVSPPLKRLMLPEGKHQIRLVNPSFPEHTVDILVSNKKRIGVIDYEFAAH